MLPTPSCIKSNIDASWFQPATPGAIKLCRPLSIYKCYVMNFQGVS